MFFQYKNPQGDLSSAVTNVEWTYISLKAERHVLYYGCCPEPYPDVTYYLKLKRKPQFYLINLIVPSMLITVMAALGYYLPVESGEKVSLQITVMLSLAVFQQLVSDKLPPSADSTPLIGRNATNTTYNLIQQQHTTNTKYRMHTTKHHRQLKNYVYK